MPTAQTRTTVTREAVLDAALTLFAQYGYHGTAVSQIAEALGVRTPSLYNHMRSKQELLYQIVDHTTAGVLADFHDAVNERADPNQSRKSRRPKHASSRRPGTQ